MLIVAVVALNVVQYLLICLNEITLNSDKLTFLFTFVQKHSSLTIHLVSFDLFMDLYKADR